MSALSLAANGVQTPKMWRGFAKRLWLAAYSPRLADPEVFRNIRIGLKGLKPAGFGDGSLAAKVEAECLLLLAKAYVESGVEVRERLAPLVRAACDAVEAACGPAENNRADIHG